MQIYKNIPIGIFYFEMIVLSSEFTDIWSYCSGIAVVHIKKDCTFRQSPVFMLVEVFKVNSF